MECINYVIGFLVGIVWHDALVVLLVSAGLYFTLRSRFVQLRLLPQMIRLLKKPSSNKAEQGISSIHAFLVSAGVRIGTGNISGVGAAIFFGGPGAVFWMWLIGIIGAASAFIEATLAQIYKEKINGEFMGGPSYCAEKGLGIKWYGPVMAVVIVVSCLLGSPGIQSNVIAASLQNSFSVPPVATAALMTAVLGYIIFGGIRRIARVSNYLVPLLCAIYSVVAIVVLAVNIKNLPGVFTLIVSCAFNKNAAFGGIAGSMIAWGVRRGVYSNEAGLGTGAPFAAAADVGHPVEQGLLQACSVYLDTIVVCSITAFVILLTGSYNVVGADGVTLLVENLPGADAEAGFIQAAVNSVLPFGNIIMAVLLVLLAFTTLYGGYFQAEASLNYLIRHLKQNTQKRYTIAARFILLVSAFWGCIAQAETAWNLADLFGGIMAWFNLILILLISKPAFIALKDYDKQCKAGSNRPVFHPEQLGIQNAEIWNEINRE